MENNNLQMGMNMKAWQNAYNFAHECSGWMNFQSSKAILRFFFFISSNLFNVDK